MKLEVGNFPVEDIAFGPRTRWKDGVLEVDREELLGLVLEEPSVGWADIQVARPGDAIRIIHVRDVIEPKIKAEGPGTVYPGIAGRPIETAGQGRTHRLGGMTIISCSDMPQVNPDGSRCWRNDGGDATFIDMAGPGAVTPFARTVNLCIPMAPAHAVHEDDWNRAILATLMKINDRLAETTLGLEPRETHTYDLDARDSSLPGVVFVPVLASAEYRFGPRVSLGTHVYGVGRLTPPWLLQPTELLDGAVFGTFLGNFTWPISETVVPYMCSRHGVDFNFLGCIVVRSNWEAEAEKRLMAHRAAQLALDVGAQGALVTTNVRGQRFLETVLTVQALEEAGVKTVLMTQEEDNEEGTAPPLLVSVPEAVAVVSTGTGGVEETFPRVEQVVGVREPEPHWFGERPPIHGRYMVDHLHDIYGFGTQGCLDF